jgi:hypothetical protein
MLSVYNLPRCSAVNKKPTHKRFLLNIHKRRRRRGSNRWPPPPLVCVDLGAPLLSVPYFINVHVFMEMTRKRCSKLDAIKNSICYSRWTHLRRHLPASARKGEKIAYVVIGCTCVCFAFFKWRCHLWLLVYISWGNVCPANGFNQGTVSVWWEIWRFFKL